MDRRTLLHVARNVPTSRRANIFCARRSRCERNPLVLPITNRCIIKTHPQSLHGQTGAIIEFLVSRERESTAFSLRQMFATTRGQRHNNLLPVQRFVTIGRFNLVVHAIVAIIAAANEYTKLPCRSKPPAVRNRALSGWCIL